MFSPRVSVQGMRGGLNQDAHSLIQGEPGGTKEWCRPRESPSYEKWSHYASLGARAAVTKYHNLSCSNSGR